MINSQYSSQTQRQADTSGHLLPAQHHIHPGLKYYIVRSNGQDQVLVPLVPADELPFNIRIQGVPRNLSRGQAAGLAGVGMQPFGVSFLTLETSVKTDSLTPQYQATANCIGRNCSSTTAFQAPDPNARQTFSRSGSSSQNLTQQTVLPPPASAHKLSSNWRSGMSSDNPQDIINKILNTPFGAAEAARLNYVPKSTTPVPPSGARPDQNKKEYCVHWIRTGECDYTQQGCMFKHEIPDRATLEKIGVRSVPRWWLEKTQSIKIGGARATVGTPVKISDWLKLDEDDVSLGGDSNGGNGHGDDNISVSDMSSAKSTKAVPASKGITTCDRVKGAEISLPPTPPSSPKNRRLSVSGDLINFEPLIPSSAASPISVAGNTEDASAFAINSFQSILTAENEHNHGDNGIPNQLGLSPVAQTTTSSITPSPTSSNSSEEWVALPTKSHMINTQPSNGTKQKVFVPANEPRERHIAQAKKRGQVQWKQRGGKVHSIDRQIQQLQRDKQNSGLLASKCVQKNDRERHVQDHAPSPEAGKKADQTATPE